MCSHIHYQLSPESGEWLLNIYPSNRRLYRDKGKPHPAPYLKLVENWHLIDVVRAAIKTSGNVEDIH
jgi:hypothetical protein